MNTVRKRITLRGRVQGVGLRYTVRMECEARRLTGWVRNEWDGSVVMEVQGRADLIRDMLDEVAAAPFLRIEDVESETIPLIRDETSFRYLMH